VYVVSNTDSVALFLNGKPMGQAQRDYHFLFTFDKIAFTPGVLEAVGYNDGKEAARMQLRTAGKPAKLKLAAIQHPKGWKADGGFQSTWGLFGILLLSALVAFCTIFLFRNRMLQIRMTIFSSILLIGYYIAFCVFMFILKGDLDAMTFQLGWALCLPVVAIILNYLAFRAIYKDEVMVKAADRLRR
jgi:hypothetical protein